MSRYGQLVCVIDATYNTNMYGLPLFMVCCPTNCGYFVVGSFLTTEETADAIAEGIKKLAEWNTNWRPAFFVSDFCEAQINAIETVFPGTVLFGL